MALTNTSYVTDGEVELYRNQTTIAQLCSLQADASPETWPVTGLRQQRLYAALNSGKNFVDSKLKGVYNVPFQQQAVSETYPDFVVKQWNMDAALLYLYRLHTDRLAQFRELWEQLNEDLARYVAPGGDTIPGENRLVSGSILVFGKEKLGTVFDSAGYWPSTIAPSDQQEFFSGR